MNAGEVTVKHSITFMLDGQAHTPPPFAPDTTLLNYLREHLYRKGTKEGCAEGDCGACTVVVADLQHGSVRYRALNACIQLLATLDGKALFTVESLQHGKQLHPVQQALVDCHASQCGFCTPVSSCHCLPCTRINPMPAACKSAKPCPAICAAAPATVPFWRQGNACMNTPTHFQTMTLPKQL